MSNTSANQNCHTVLSMGVERGGTGGHIPSILPGGGAHVPDPHRHCNNEQLGQIGEDSGVHHIHEPHKPEI